MSPQEHVGPFVEHARRYSELGWALVRLNGKVPREKDWQQAKPDLAELAAGKWSHWGERHNIGVVLGPSGLAVVEPDTEEARAVLLDLFGGELPQTPIVESGGKSLHVYFVDDSQGNATVDGLELRAGPQQCVLPPSIHPETKRPYVWRDGHEPWNVPPIAIPAQVLAFFAGTLFHAKRADPVGDEIHEKDPGRHKTLLSLAGSMRRRGLGFDEIAAALQATNSLRCKPPLPDEEVVALVADVVCRYEPAPRDPVREQLEHEADRLLREWEKPPEPEHHARRQTAPLIVSLVEFLGGDEDNAAWLVDHLAARSALVLVAGLPKVGKSTFVYGLLGALTSSADRFVGLPAGSTWALLMTEEPAATVEEKVDRFDVDDERVFVIEQPVRPRRAATDVQCALPVTFADLRADDLCGRRAGDAARCGRSAPRCRGRLSSRACSPCRLLVRFERACDVGQLRLGGADQLMLMSELPL